VLKQHCVLSHVWWTCWRRFFARREYDVPLFLAFLRSAPPAKQESGGETQNASFEAWVLHQCVYFARKLEKCEILKFGVWVV
jgi:hypothetical protein